MPHVGQEIRRGNGFVVKIVRLEDEVLELEARYRGDAPLAQAHYHPSQDEHFEVLSGRIHAVIDGEERWYDEGASPALQTAEFFERFYDALDNGFPEGTTAADFLREYSDVFRLTAADRAS